MTTTRRNLTADFAFGPEPCVFPFGPAAKIVVESQLKIFRLFSCSFYDMSYDMPQTRGSIIGKFSLKKNKKLSLKALFLHFHPKGILRKKIQIQT